MQQIFEIQPVFLICVICVLCVVLLMLSDQFPEKGSDILHRS
jgi:hypothetical protein